MSLSHAHSKSHSKSKNDKGTEALIAYKLDRLTRSVVDLNRLLELFDKHI